MSDYQPSSPNYTDRDNLMKRAYADERHLETRVRTHELYTVPQFSFPEWVLGQHQHWQGNEWVLDVGCGMGVYIDQIQERIPQGHLFATDLSYGMINRATQNDHPQRATFFVQDAQHIAFPANTFDIVLANHMLYHMPDINDALNEIHRVLKPNGVLITAVNSQFTMLEFATLKRRALTLLGYPPADEENTISYHGFDLENGSVKLARHFRGVVRYEVPSALVFKDPQPVIAYVDSLRSLDEDNLPAGVAWEDYMMVMTNQIDRLISHFGELIINKLSGVLIASDGGGFAAKYFETLDGK